MAESIDVEKKRQEKLRAFRDKIRQFREEEISGARKSSHFTYPAAKEFHPDELTEADADIWEKIESGILTRAEWDEYRRGFFGENGVLRKEITPSRYDFMQLAANRANVIFTEQAIKEMDRLEREDR